jgi:hypothetical protein
VCVVADLQNQIWREGSYIDVSKYCSSVQMALFMITVVINLGPPLSIGRMRMRGWHDTESSSLVFIFLWSSLGSSALLLLTDYALKEEEIQREY